MDSLLENLMRGQASPREPLVTDFIFFCLVTLGAVLATLGLAGGLTALRTGISDGSMQVAAIAVMLAPAYLTYRRMAFTSEVSHQKALPRFTLVLLGGALSGLSLTYIGAARLGLPLPLALALAALPVLFLSFAALRLWVFARN